MERDITGTSTIDVKSLVDDFSVSQQSTDGPQEGKKNFYDNPYFTKWYGYYNDKSGEKGIPELKKNIDAFATWVLGKGFTADDKVLDILESITGRGEEDFLAILWNLKVISKVNGDSYAEIIRDPETGTLINLKPLSPEYMRTIFSSKGMIEEYEDRRTGKKIAKEKILHFCNDRVADELGGTSVVPVVKWYLDAMNEALSDKRRMLHLSTIRMIEVDEDEPGRLKELKRDYKDAIKNGTVLLVPKGTGKPEDLTSPTSEHIQWIRELGDKIYVAIGTPKSVMGSAENIPESGGKISYLTYEQIYSRETRQMENDIWNQLAIRIKFNSPASIAEGVTDEANKNQAQTGFQPQDTKI